MLFFLMAAAVAGVTQAVTPPNFEPSASQDLKVAFGSTPALNGVGMARALTASAPTLGTPAKLWGSYTVVMVDPDVPGGPGAPTSEFLHWLQSDLVSTDHTVSMAGESVHTLESATAPLAAYMQPSPPARDPLSHRYVQLLLNTTDNAAAVHTLATFAGVRQMFDARDVLERAGVQASYGNWFNVTYHDGAVAP